MSFLVYIMLGIVTLLGSILAKVLADDLKTFVPRFCERLIVKSSKKLHPDYADDFQEEWLAHLAERPELTGKLLHAGSLYLWGATNVGTTVGFAVPRKVGLTFDFVKRTFDIVMCILLAPVLLVTAFVLVLVNPFKNRGPLFFVQTRMGKNCKPFRTIKFRSMICATGIVRDVDDPLEIDRITKIGNFLRRSRLDEIPQIINVLNGDMSIVGPRPDYIVHAEEYIEGLSGYKERHAVRPGISGYAQTEIGYIESREAIKDKVEADLYYIKNRSLRLEMWILWRTALTVLTGGEH